MNVNALAQATMTLLAVIGALSLCGMAVWCVTKVWGLFIDVKDLKNRIDYLSRKVMEHED